jgi:thioredoxin-related protein
MQPSPHAIELPRWFVETFLDFREDVREARAQGKRLLVYFGQDGCPYCKLLMQTTFTETRVVDLVRRGFVPIALNLWGDREVTWVDGRKMTEKQLGTHLSVQFTPTLLLFNEKGDVIARLNGYQSPPRMAAALQYAIDRLEAKQPFADYMQRVRADPASATLHDEPFFLKPPYLLTRKPGARPLAVLFERTHCSSCDELHSEALRRKEVAELLPRFDIARFTAKDEREVITPDGQKTTADAWAQQLKIVYAPTWLFFDASGEVFRVESYTRPFHLASALEYVATGAYRNEPNFQRFVQARAERLRASGQSVDLWK